MLGAATRHRRLTAAGPRLATTVACTLLAAALVTAALVAALFAAALVAAALVAAALVTAALVAACTPPATLVTAALVTAALVTAALVTAALVTATLVAARSAVSATASRATIIAAARWWIGAGWRRGIAVATRCGGLRSVRVARSIAVTASPIGIPAWPIVTTVTAWFVALSRWLRAPAGRRG